MDTYIIVGALLGVILFAVIMTMFNKGGKNFNCSVGIYRLVGKRPYFRYTSRALVTELKEDGKLQGVLKLEKGMKEVGTYSFDDFIPKENGGYHIDLIEKEPGTFEILTVTVDNEKLGKNAIPYGVKETMQDTIHDVNAMFEPKKSFLDKYGQNIVVFLIFLMAVSMVIVTTGDLKDISTNYKEGGRMIAAGLQALDMKVNQTKIDFIYETMLNESMTQSEPAPGATNNNNGGGNKAPNS